MDWYELDKGPLMALKSLLDSPLSFDSVDYIDRTFIKNNKSIDKDIVKLAQFYNETRKNLFSKVSSHTLTHKYFTLKINSLYTIYADKIK